MIAPKSARNLFFFILLSLCLFQFAWADKIYLKNGNVLEGRIVGEKAQVILFEYSLESGSGRAEIRKTEIKSVEKGIAVDLKKDKITSFPKDQWLSKAARENLEKKKKWLTYSVLTAFFMLSFLSLSILNKVLKVELNRPLGITIGCLFVNAVNIAFGFLGLLLFSLAIKRVVFDLRGVSLFTFCFLTIGIPAGVFISIFGLFYLRKWARRLWIILLVIGLLTGVAALVNKKDFAGGFLPQFYQRAMEGIGKERPQLYQNIINIFGEFKVPEAGISFNPRIIYITTSSFLLCLLYLFREKTKEAFSQGPQYRLFPFINKRKPNHDVSSDAAKEKIVKIKGFVSKGLIEYEALGYNFYLPAGMEQMHSSLPESSTAMFLEKKKNMIFSIAKLKEGEYKEVTDSLFTRSSPFFGMLKTLSAPRYLCKTISIKEVEFEGKKGIMQVGSKDDIILYRFILKIGKEGFIECAFVHKKDDTSFDEKKVLNIIAAIR